jgi:hypothetical protein
MYRKLVFATALALACGSASAQIELIGSDDEIIRFEATSSTPDRVRRQAGMRKGEITPGESFYQTDRAVFRRDVLGYPCDTPTTGIYWLTDETIANGQANPHFDPSKKTIIYVHGWQQGSVARNTLHFYLGNQYIDTVARSREPFGADGRLTDSGVAEDYVRAFRDNGWNVGVFYWTQWADDVQPNLPSVLDDKFPEPWNASAKIWTTNWTNNVFDHVPGINATVNPRNELIGNRFRKCDGSFAPTPASSPYKNKPVGQIFFEAYRDALAGFSGSQLVVAGHSLGHQVVAAGMKRVIDAGPAQVPQPTKITFLDPYWPPKLSERFTTQIGGALTGCDFALVFSGNCRMLNVADYRMYWYLPLNSGKAEGDPGIAGVAEQVAEYVKQFRANQIKVEYLQSSWVNLFGGDNSGKLSELIRVQKISNDEFPFQLGLNAVPRHFLSKTWWLQNGARSESTDPANPTVFGVESWLDTSLTTLGLAYSPRENLAYSSYFRVSAPGTSVLNDSIVQRNGATTFSPADDVFWGIYPSSVTAGQTPIHDMASGSRNLGTGSTFTQTVATHSDFILAGKQPFYANFETSTQLEEISCALGVKSSTRRGVAICQETITNRTNNTITTNRLVEKSSIWIAGARYTAPRVAEPLKLTIDLNQFVNPRDFGVANGVVYVIKADGSMVQTKRTHPDTQVYTPVLKWIDALPGKNLIQFDNGNVGRVLSANGELLVGQFSPQGSLPFNDLPHLAYSVEKTGVYQCGGIEAKCVNEEGRDVYLSNAPKGLIVALGGISANSSSVSNPEVRKVLDADFAPFSRTRGAVKADGSTDVSIPAAIVMSVGNPSSFSQVNFAFGNKALPKAERSVLLSMLSPNVGDKPEGYDPARMRTETTRPAKPTASLASKTATSAVINTSSTSSDVATYVVSVTADSGTAFTSASNASPPVTVAGLTASTAYTAFVTAVDRQGNRSDASDAVRFTTSASGGGGGGTSCGASFSVINVAALDGKTWTLQPTLAANSKVYTDRAYTFNTLPASLIGDRHIQSAGDSKASTNNPLARMTICGGDAKLSIALRDNVAKPSWMSAFVDTGQSVKINLTGCTTCATTVQSFKIYSRTVPSGVLELGPNVGDTMYVPFIEEATAAPPATALTLSNLAALDGKIWTQASNLQVGSKVYSDRTYTYKTMPTALRGLAFVQTANDSKSSTQNPLGRFSVNRAARIYVLLRDSIAKPSWMSAYSDSGLTVQVDQSSCTTCGGVTTTTMKVWQLDVAAAGTVNFGPIQSTSMYTITAVAN